MRPISSIIAAVMLASVAMTTPAAANVLPTAESVASALQKAGYKALVGTDATGDPKVQSAANGANFSVYFYGCTDHKNHQTIQFYTSYNVKNVTTQAINKWNYDARFASAALLEDGTPGLKMDVSLEDGGMPDRLFAEYLDWWSVVMGLFQKHIGY